MSTSASKLSHDSCLAVLRLKVGCFVKNAFMLVVDIEREREREREKREEREREREEREREATSCLTRAVAK